VVIEASGACTDPVYYALCEQDFEQMVVFNPAHVKGAARAQDRQICSYV